MTDNQRILRTIITYINLLKHYTDKGLSIDNYVKHIIDDINFVIDDLENQPKILYLCDEQQCSNCSQTPCHHTMDINHAKNFKKIADGKYMEQVDAIRRLNDENKVQREVIETLHKQIESLKKEKEDEISADGISVIAIIVSIIALVIAILTSA